MVEVALAERLVEVLLQVGVEVGDEYCCFRQVVGSLLGCGLVWLLLEAESLEISRNLFYSLRLLLNFLLFILCVRKRCPICCEILPLLNIGVQNCI